MAPFADQVDDCPVTLACLNFVHLQAGQLRGARLRRWLCNKHKEPLPGYKRFPEESLNSVYGLVQLPHRTANLPWAKA